MGSSTPSEAYRHTSYWVEAPQRYIRIRIGEANGDLDNLLVERGVDKWAFITAFNPGARKLTPTENAERHVQLMDRIAQGGYEILSGLGVGDDGTWPPERSVLVLGIRNTEAREIGAFARMERSRAGATTAPGNAIRRPSRAASRPSRSTAASLTRRR